MKRKWRSIIISAVALVAVLFVLQGKEVKAANGYELRANSIRFYFDYPQIEKEVQIFNYKGTKIQDKVFTSGWTFTLPKNSVYTFKAFVIDPSTNEKELKATKKFATAAPCKVKFKKKGPKFVFKTYKGSGIKNYALYVSTNGKTYKKVKTIKAGKKYTMKKFRKKKLKKNKLYYYKLLVNNNASILTLESNNSTSRYFGYTVRYRFK